MSTVIVTKEKEVELNVGGKLFHVCQGDDGTLYIEAVGPEQLEVTTSDDDEAQVTAIGTWVNIDLVTATDESL